MSQEMFLAKALFDNVAESPDELAFRKGEVLTILEQDTKGLDGWWLCSLRGKQGIAPGNRLKIMSGMTEGARDTANKMGSDLYNHPKSGHLDYDVPPSNRSFSSRRPSYDALRNFTGSRKALLGDDSYDTPPSSKRGSAENPNGIYDTPPSSKRASSERTPPHSNRSSASRESGSNLLLSNSPSQLSLNLPTGSSQGLPTVIRRRRGSNSSDTCSETSGSSRSSLDKILSEEGPPIYESLSPAVSTEHLDTGDPTYDTPPPRSRILSQINLASQSSLGSAASSESLLSNTSSVSSAHMSRNASLPDSARSSMDLPSDIYDVPPPGKGTDRSRKQLSMDSGLGFYDSPLRSRPSSSNSNTVTLDGMKSSRSSFDCKPSPSSKDIKRSKSLENAVDDLYDTPKNNAPKIGQKKLGGNSGSDSSSTFSDSSGVYDIPPQVTRDSVISMRSDSSDESQRLSSSSLDNEQQMAEILLWDELLLDLDSALELLVKRQQDVLKATSRLASFVNTSWRSKSSLEKTLYDIKLSCTLVRNSLRDFVDYSHGAIVNAAKLPDRHLTSRLQKYVSPLHSTLDLVNRSFINLEEMKWQVSLLSEPLDNSRPDDLGQIALVAKELMPEVKKVAYLIQSNGPILFKKASIGDGKMLSVSSKPPLGPKLSDSNGGKGSGYGYGRPKTMQQRPLPAVPISETYLPSLEDKPTLSLYRFKAALHNDDYVECDELPAENDPEQTKKDVPEQCIDDYDYIQLDSRDADIKSQSPAVDSVKDNDIDSNQDDIDAISISKSNDTSIKDSIPTKDLDTVDSDLELIPVKETSSDNNMITADSNSDHKLPPALKEVSSCDSSEDVTDLESSEQDLKTPVNVNSSSSGSDFILPSPDSNIVTTEPGALDPNDHQVLVYYAEQMNAHSTLLANAIDAFIGVVGKKEPPNIFISHSKFVIVSAHKLVHIGDSIHRNLTSNSVSMRVMQCANHLCDCLKASVTATKSAALQYPSAPAVQEMVDRVIAVSHAAHELKLIVTHAAKQ